MFKVKIKKPFNKKSIIGETINVYQIKTDSATGFPQFVFYYDGQWLCKSAKYFEPVKAVIINERWKI